MRKTYDDFYDDFSRKKIIEIKSFDEYIKSRNNLVASIMHSSFLIHDRYLEMNFQDISYHVPYQYLLKESLLKDNDFSSVIEIKEFFSESLEKNITCFSTLYSEYGVMYRVCRSNINVPIEEGYEYSSIKKKRINHKENEGLFFGPISSLISRIAYYGDLVCEIICDPNILKYYKIKNITVYADDTNKENCHARYLLVGKVYSIYDIRLYKYLARRGIDIKNYWSILKRREYFDTSKCSSTLLSMIGKI